MTKKELGEDIRSHLAQKCRNGQLEGALVGSPETFLRNLETASPEALIAACLKCSVCGHITMPVHEAVRYARYAKTVEGWIRFLVGYKQQFGECRHGMDESIW